MNIDMCPLEIVGLKSNLADTIQVLRDFGYVHIDELAEAPEISARPLTLDRETLAWKDLVAQKYAHLTYNGQWFTALKEQLDAYIEKAAQFVSGEIATAP